MATNVFGEPVYRPIIGVAKGFLGALGLRIDIVGSENIPLTGGAVLAMSHMSYLDFILGGLPADAHGQRLVRYMAKDAIFQHWFAGPFMRGMRHISVDRTAGAQAFDNAVDALKAGELVGVFPEATMSRSLEIKGLKSGAVRMAQQADVPLIPMTIFGGHRILSYTRRDFTRGRPVCITVGAPMPTAGDPSDVTAELRTRMATLLDETLARYPDKPEGAWWVPARLGGSAPTLEEAAVAEAELRARQAAKRDARKRR